jgi:hypothetical protein
MAIATIVGLWAAGCFSRDTAAQFRDALLA